MDVASEAFSAISRIRRRYLIAFLLSSSLAASPASASLVQQGPKLVATDAVGPAHQGISVAVSADGNTAIVGGDYDNGNVGAAWVYTRSGGAWNQQAKLVGNDAGLARQGVAVALSADGNTAIVGGDGDNGNVGAAWVYTRSGGTWSQQGPKIVGTGAVGAASQGHSVALSADGNTAIVGGLVDNGSAGAAWVYTRSGGTWSQQGPKLVGTDAVGLAVSQGISVAVSGDGNTAIVGGYGDDGFVGAAWVYTRSGGTWNQQGPKLVATDAVGDGYVYQGHSVALSADGNTAIVGGDGDNINVGAVWAYARSGGTWSQQGPKLVGTDATGPAHQGISVAVSADGSTVVEGGLTDAFNYMGAAWVFANNVQATLAAAFFCDRQGVVPIPAHFLNSSATGTAKVCADGADAGYVALQVASGSFDLSHVRFRIKEDVTGAHEVYGYFTDHGPAVPNGISYRYVDPSTPPPDSLLSSLITFQAYDSQSGAPVFECPVAVYRAPVVMVHGIWSNSQSFALMHDLLLAGRQYAPDLLYPVDYSFASARGFHYNRDVVSNAIDWELLQCRRAGYAAAKVDIVAHSMGGLLARLYLQDSYTTAVPYRGDINRLLTLNSPYWGSQAANLLFDTTILVHDPVVLAFQKTNRDPTQGAADNLRVDSFETTVLLNGPGLINATVVPTHVIVTQGVLANQSNDDSFVLLYRTVGVSLCRGSFYSVDALVSEVFGGHSSDVIVAVESQRGGARAGEVVGGQLHTGSPANSMVISSVRNALNTPSSDASVWGGGGFAFTQLAYVSPKCPSQAQQAVVSARTSSGSISIEAPLDGAVVAPGASVSVSITGSADITNFLVAALSSSDTVRTTEAAGPNTTWSFTVPQDAIGNLVVMVFGNGLDPAPVYASVTLSVAIPALLDSVEARPPGYVVSAGAQFGEALFGHYDDGVVRRLVGVPGVTIESSDPAVVNAVTPDSIVAIGTGTAILTLGYQGRTSSVPVTVSIDAVTGVEPSSPPGGLEKTRILAVAPNPSRAGVSIRFVLGLGEGVTQLDVFDVQGRRVRQLISDTNLGAGMHSATWDGRKDSGGLASAGLYFVTLHAGTSRSRTKFILLR